jgi:hypothetical protein
MFFSLKSAEIVNFIRLRGRIADFRGNRCDCNGYLLMYRDGSVLNFFGQKNVARYYMAFHHPPFNARATLLGSPRRLEIYNLYHKLFSNASIKSGKNKLICRFANWSNYGKQVVVRLKNPPASDNCTPRWLKRKKSLTNWSV